MFKKIKAAVSHENTQKALFKSIIAVRKANKKARANARKLKDDTKQTFKDAMSAELN